MDNLLACGIVAAVLLGIVAAMAGVLMWAWNMTLVPWLGWPVIGFWQALAVSILLNIVGGIFKTTITRKEQNDG